MSDRLLSADALTQPLAFEDPTELDVMDGYPRISSGSFGDIEGAEVGLWQMTEGVVRDTEVDEIFVVIGGSARIDFEDGEQLEVGEGSVVRLRAGERTIWRVHSTLRKVYISAVG
ncbi:MAG: cupin domain-containing protein [Micrococcales bacterium]|nr:cupin domain-containing protein [Micrococcales bacterium]